MVFNPRLRSQVNLNNIMIILKKTLNQNLSYRISKYLGLEVVNAINNSKNPDKIIADLLNYASSQTGDSAIFVKAS
jgi:hypothetical protein